ncbi:hypothetical protein DY000_02021867 [Brassica cretica]|uniref:DUF4005 domain-containing protein n=1 Tax=Brassica cretica TaxID=69181 RepID=A0ABQ7E402_BRACR|nr:hypothetical protein DY000_02021867 [Brassica cretica]
MSLMQSRERSYEDEVKMDSGRSSSAVRRTGLLGRSPNWTWTSSANGRAESAFDPAQRTAELNSTEDLACSIRRTDH